MKIGGGLTTGVSVRLDAFTAHGCKPVSLIGPSVQINDSVHIEAIENGSVWRSRIYN